MRKKKKKKKKKAQAWRHCKVWGYVCKKTCRFSSRCEWYDQPIPWIIIVLETLIVAYLPKNFPPCMEAVFPSLPCSLASILSMNADALVVNKTNSILTSSSSFCHTVMQLPLHIALQRFLHSSPSYTSVTSPFRPFFSSSKN
jgi:hypothetical protein